MNTGLIRIRNAIVAGTAAIAMFATASLVAADPADARDRTGAALAGGFVLGAIVGSVASRPAYAAPLYAAPAYPVPVYNAPVYNAPVYTAPVYTAPAYPAPVYSAPVYPARYYGPSCHWRSKRVWDPYLGTYRWNRIRVCR